jgi:membrane protease YdiL (CAAX protease family)
MVLWSAFLGFLILFVGQSIWSILLVANFRRGATIPWSVPVMAIVLWAMWQYLGGRWWPRSNSQQRHRLLRANGVTSSGRAWVFLSGVCAMIALAGYWIVFFQLVKTPPNVMPDLSKYPWSTVVLVLAMSSLVSPIVEEAAFRGYCQQILEREFAGPIAVAISSLLFMLAHANHGWYWPKLVVYLLAGVVFGTVVYLTNSILASIPVHIVGDATFFTLVWPFDATRHLITEGGADVWFWIHVVQAIVFTVLAVVGFRSLARHSLQKVHTAAMN